MSPRAPASSVRGLVLDVAGTVLIKPGLVPAIAASFTAFGHEVADVVIARRHKLLSEAVDIPDRPDGAFYRDFNRRLIAACGVTPSDALADEIYERCRGLSWQADPGLDALTALGLPLAAASNWDRTLEAQLAAATTVPFAGIVGSAAAGRRKPDPTLLRSLLAELGWDPAHTAVVGDSVRLDVAPGRAVGAQTVLIDRLDLYRSHEGHRVFDLAELARRLAQGGLGDDDEHVSSS